jgi:hypothetical protein
VEGMIREIMERCQQSFEFVVIVVAEAVRQRGAEGCCEKLTGVSISEISPYQRFNMPRIP